MTNHTSYYKRVRKAFTFIFHYLHNSRVIFMQHVLIQWIFSDGGSVLTSPGTQATVVGWGRLGRDEDAPHSNVLQAVTIPVLDVYDCADQTGLGVYPDQVRYSQGFSIVSQSSFNEEGKINVY